MAREAGEARLGGPARAAHLLDDVLYADPVRRVQTYVLHRCGCLRVRSGKAPAKGSVLQLFGSRGDENAEPAFRMENGSGGFYKVGVYVGNSESTGWVEDLQFNPMRRVKDLSFREYEGGLRLVVILGVRGLTFQGSVWYTLAD